MDIIPALEPLQARVSLSKLFYVFVKLSYEMNDFQAGVAFFDKVINLPWSYMDETGFCDTLHWLVMSSSIQNVLNFGIGEKCTEKSVMKLLQISSQLIDANDKIMHPTNDPIIVGRQRRLVASVSKMFQMCQANCHSFSGVETELYKKGLSRFMEVLSGHYFASTFVMVNLELGYSILYLRFRTCLYISAGRVAEGCLGNIEVTRRFIKP